MQNQNQVQIKVKDEMLGGTYCNMMQIIHSKEEFVLDFVFQAPPQAMLNARVITSPGHMKRILNALTENIQRYENTFGPIQESAIPTQQFGF